MMPRNSNIKLFCFYLTLSIVTPLQSLSQVVKHANIEKYKEELQENPNDTSLVRIYVGLGFDYHRINIDSAEYYGKLGYEKAKQLKFPKGIAAALGTLGVIEYAKSNYDQALDYYNQAITIYTTLDDQVSISKVNNYIGVIHRLKGNFLEAINIYTKSLKINQALKNEIGVSMVYNNLGVSYRQLGEYDSAFIYYFKSAELKSKLGDDKALANTYNNIGNLKVSLKEYESAESFMLKALKMQSDMQDIKGLSHSYQNIGLLKFKQGLNAEAKDYYQKALDIYIRLNDKRGISNIYNLKGLVEIDEANYNSALSILLDCLIQKQEIGDKMGEAKALKNIATCYYNIDQPINAIQYAEKSLGIAQSIGAKNEAKESSEFLYNLFHEQDNIKKAFKYRLVFNAYKDSLLNEQKALEIAQIESKFTLNQIKRENELLQKEQSIRENRLLQSKLQIENQSTILIALFICLIFAILAAIFWYMYTRKKHKTIFLLQELNSEISYQKNKIELQAKQLQEAHKEVKTMNESLEDIVKRRTEKIKAQNKKLRDYAFANSHEVRAPLANLLGLVNISALDNVSKEESDFIFEKISESALDLNKVIKRVNKLLEEEEL